jgi:4-hydroxybenzoate polyprenyltransferase
MSFLLLIINDILYNGHLQSFGAAGLVFLTSIIFHISIPYISIVFVYFLFLFVFYTDRYIHVDRDYSTNMTRSKHIKQFSQTMPWIIILLLFISIVGALLFTNTTVAATFVFLAIAGYAYPKYMKDYTRYIPLFKNIYVSAVYPIAVILPELLTTQHIGDMSMKLFLMSAIFIESFIAQILLDTKDIPSDREHGLKTLGVLIGFNETLHITSLFSVGIGIFFLLYGFVHMYPYELLWILMLSIVLRQVAIFFVSRQNVVGYSLCAGMLLWWIVYYGIYRLYLL